MRSPQILRRRQAARDDWHVWVLDEYRVDVSTCAGKAVRRYKEYHLTASQFMARRNEYASTGIVLPIFRR
jgi:hypothetical protein